MPLQTHLAICEDDTRRIISQRTANFLARWRDYQTEEEYVQYIRSLIRNPAGQKNGWEIDQQGGVSLESIVLDLEPDLFDNMDKKIAAKTLGRKSTAS